MADVVLSIDQGTTNTKTLLVDTGGRIISRSSFPVNIRYPQPGWVEQDPVDIWNSVKKSARECISVAGKVNILAIAISNQRESALVWERKTGKPAGPVVVWQCRKSAPFCKKLRESGIEKKIWEKSGLVIDPMFSAGKIRWLLDHLPDGIKRAENGELCSGTIDSWLLWKLTSGAVHACDISNASRTQLMNLEHTRWDDDLIEWFGIPKVSLPKIVMSAHTAGVTKNVSGLPDDIPVAAMIGDSHAALFGQGGFRPGSVKATYGTGSSIMSLAGNTVANNRSLSSTVAWGLNTGIFYALEGNITSTGATVQWVSDLLRMKSAKEVAELASEADDNGGVFIVPAFTGLGAPHWNDRARGLITGLTRGTEAKHIARAAIESIAFQVHDVFKLMNTANESKLLADGGGSQNNSLMQFQADLLQCPVLRNNDTDISALGASYLAGLELGIWKNLREIEELPRSFDRFEPNMNSDDRDRIISAWAEAVERAVYVPEIQKL